MTSYFPISVQDSVNSLLVQITNVYNAFINHTKFFFKSPNTINSNLIDANINATGNINLLSNINTIVLSESSASPKKLVILWGALAHQPTDLSNYTNGSLFISTDGILYIINNETWKALAIS